MFEKIAFIGAGSMGEAILSGLIAKHVVDASQIYVTNKTDENRLQELEETYHIHTSYNKEEVIKDASVVLLTMKPYDLDDALTSIRSYITEDQLVISVAAGQPIDHIAGLLKGGNPIVRAMPNTSASIGLSATALSAGKQVNAQERKMATKLFETIGHSDWIDEEDMHIITSIAGSGPAYFYYLVEEMEKAAIASGLDPQTASTFIRQTILGAGHMLQNKEITAAELRKRITSPNGTTEAGIRALDDHNFAEAVHACVQSAKDRSIELGKK
ncbi:MAG TPA: pyrroline-5-carboxylate reductase [Bacillota bacterium]|nr:pyrroline-5-carboxylate reductase [Bacillota bacterium]